MSSNKFEPKVNINIVFFLPNFNGGGAERVALNYIKALNHEQYQITVLLIEKKGELLSQLPSYVNVVALGVKQTRKSLPTLIKFIQLIRPDWVYTTHHRTATIVTIAKLFSKKFMHIARLPTMPSIEYKRTQYGCMRRYFYRLGYNFAEIILAQTEAMKEDVINMFSIPEKKIMVLHNPVDKRHIADSILGQASPFVDKNIITAVASGRLIDVKGFDVLIKAIPEVIKYVPLFHLYILGKDYGEMDRLKSIAQELDILNSISFLGYVDNPYPYYVNCDVFILSSKWEGFPNAMLENYYLNTPIVATKCVPVIESLILEGENGYLCDIEDDASLAKKIILCLESIKRVDVHNTYQFFGLESLLS